MITFLKACVASFVSKEMAACKNRYNNKCTEVRKLTEKISEAEGRLADSHRSYMKMNCSTQGLKSAVAEKNLEIERLNNQIMLTDMVVEQQTQIIKRDLEMRRLEHVDASIRTRMASAMAGQEAKEGPKNGVDESDINYRPGR
jgi:chromosome segregation ATPase